MNHTWHPNTFGLLYGKTTKTACSKRRPTEELVSNLSTNCPVCQDVILQHFLDIQAMYMTVHELRIAGLLPPADPTATRRPTLY